ncbi:MAG: MFS transporter [Spirochaetia bacterium]|nr:MFS transporter [Spirochaetia bacterium]
MNTKKYSYLTMFGHLCSDINQGALPAILPFLVLHNGFNYTAVASLVFATNLTSALVQPLFGYLGDKVGKPWFMALGVFLAGAGLSCVGFLENYWEVFFAVAVSGLGVALFHPEGGRIANFVAGKEKAKGMSIFAVGGNIGFAIGPIIASGAIAIWGMKGTAVLIIPASVCAIVILSQNKVLITFSKKHKTELLTSEEKDNWRAFNLLMVVQCSRAIIYYALTTFIPLFCVVVLMQTEAFSVSMISLFAVVGAFATLAGGRIADRYGLKKLICATSTAIVPLIVLFALSKNIEIAIILIGCMAVGIDLAYSSTIVLGQKFLPNHIGMAAGISLGVAISVGGMATPILGLIGDNYGLEATLLCVAALSVIGAIFSYIIPKPANDK